MVTWVASKQRLLTRKEAGDEQLRTVVCDRVISLAFLLSSCDCVISLAVGLYGRSNGFQKKPLIEA